MNATNFEVEISRLAWQLQRLAKVEAQLDLDIGRINEQVGIAKLRAKFEGHLYDAKWFQSASVALATKRRQHQQVVERRASLSKTLRQLQHASSEERRARERSFEREFMVQAKGYLAKEAYEEIINRTKRVVALHEPLPAQLTEIDQKAR